ncbi:MAG TPA: acyltransferase [Telmatospirillum sp.]|nr:acyltransferase [Telmatospirillum sp.]
MTTTRNHALDHLRVFVIFLVIVLHASISYMAYAPTWWYVLDPQRSMVFTELVLLIDVPIMFVMFFLAGYFTYPSLAKRGPRFFLKEKFVRIAIPWAFGVLVLAPPTSYLIYFSRHAPMSLGTFWRTDFWGPAFQQSVYWYLGVLLLFFTLTALLFAVNRRFACWKPQTSRPTWRIFLAFLSATSAGSLIVGLAYTLDQWSHIYLLVYQPVRVPLYVGYFALGIFAHQRRWFIEGGYTPSLLRWLPLCLLSGCAYLASRIALPPAMPATAAKTTAILLFNLFCLSSLMASLALFLGHTGSDSRFWRSQARNSYGIYYLHPLILYPLALTLVPLPLSIYAKAIAITIAAYLISWGASAAILTRLPGLRRMF